MNTIQENKVQQTTNQKKMLMWLVLSMIILSLVSVYFYQRLRTKVGVTTAPSQEEKEKLAWNPRGSIFLTLAMQGTTTSSGIFEYNIEANKLTPYYTPAQPVITGKFERSNQSNLFASERQSDNTFQIVEIKGGVATKVTDTATRFKRHPSKSASLGSIVYSAKGKRVSALGVPDEFNVYVKGEDGKEKKLGQGTMPALTPDGKAVVVLRSNGLYKIDLETATSEKIWGLVSGKSALNQQFTISPSGKYIAWTYPDGEKIYITQVSSWAPFKGQLKYVLKAHGFWPVFSVNEEYIAFEEVDWNNPPTKPRIVITNLSTLARKVVQDLSAYDQMRMFITDWK